MTIVTLAILLAVGTEAHGRKFVKDGRASETARSRYALVDTEIKLTPGGVNPAPTKERKHRFGEGRCVAGSQRLAWAGVFYFGVRHAEKKVKLNGLVSCGHGRSSAAPYMTVVEVKSRRRKTWPVRLPPKSEPGRLRFGRSRRWQRSG